jgi:hypothetical protein
LEEDGPIVLVVQLGEHQNGGEIAAISNEEDEEKKTRDESTREVDIEDDDEHDVETSEMEAPNWVHACSAEQRQTLSLMSVVRLCLVPQKNSVKCEVYIV